MAILFGVTAVVSSATAAGRRGHDRVDWDEMARKRKAEYVLYQSAVAQSKEAGSMGEYAALLQHAHALDPADAQIAGEWGLMMLSVGSKDSLTVDRNAKAVIDRYYADPTDYNNGIVAARVASMFNHEADLVPIWTKMDSAFPSKTDPAINLASSYLVTYLKGDTSAYSKAIDIYNDIERGTGKDIGLTNFKLRAYALRNDTASAIDELQSLYRSAPLDPAINLYVGKGFTTFSRPDSSLVYLKRACELDSTNGQAFLALAAYYNQMGDSVAFDREIFRALKSPYLEFEPKMEMLTGYVSALYTDSTQWPRIEELFDVMMDVNPGESKLHELFGAYLVERHAYDRAGEQFDYAAQLDPSNSDARVTVVRLKFVNDDVEGALNSALEAIPLFPGTMQFNILASSAYSMLGREKEAIAVLDTIDLTRYHPRGGSEVLQVISDNYFKLGMPDSAISYSERAIALNPDNVVALNNTAYYLSEQGTGLDRAERYAETALRSDPDNPTYLDTYAWVFFKKKDYAKARKYIDATLAVLSLTRTDTIDSIIDRAMVDIAGADVIEKADDELLDGNSDQAVETIEELAAEYDENSSSEIFHHAGDIYFMNGEPDKAVEFWKEALKREPDNELLKRKVDHRTFYYK